MKYKTHFYTIFEDGNLVLSNNSVERAVKQIVMGRKNFLFSQSIKGAQAVGNIQSVLETAGLNNIDCRLYIEYLLDKLANVDKLSTFDFESVMPWADEPQKYFNMNNRSKTAVA